eukprot:932064-Prymnesium_polylepis.1
MLAGCALKVKTPRVARMCVHFARRATPDQLTAPQQLRALRAMRFGVPRAPRPRLPQRSMFQWGSGDTRTGPWRFGVASILAIGRHAL